MKKILGYFGGAVGVVVIIMATGVGNYVGKKAVDNYQDGKTDGLLEQGQAEAAAELRKQLPMQIDDVTTLQNVISMGTTLAYHYNIAANKADIDMNLFTEQMQKQLKTNTCEQKDMANTIKYGGKYTYMYMSADGLRLGQFTFGKEECGFE